jgi:aspergillopepsin I
LVYAYSELVSASFTADTQNNGLVGLAFSSINTVQPRKVKTFLDNIQHDLALPLMTANLKHDTPGSYGFGVIDSTLFTGNLSFTPVDNSNGFWQFESAAFAVGDGELQPNLEGNPAIADTGTSLLLLDQSVVDGYWSQVPGAVFSNAQGGIIFPCDANLPDLHVALGANNLGTIPGSLLNFAQVSTSR